MNKTIVAVCIVCILTLMSHIVLNTLDRCSTLEAILSNQLSANRMLKSQVEELVYTMDLKESEVYNRGFNAGKTQMGLAMMNDEAMVGYKEGYHAALEQWEKFPPTPKYPPGFPPFPTPAELFSQDEE